MNYHKQYGLLIKKGLQRIDLKGYYEKHHIKPRCMGGTDFKHNIVYLTAKEHYMAHWFLVKIYPEHSGLICGLHRMTYGNQSKYLKLSARDYERVRILFSVSQSNFMIEYLKTKKGKIQIEEHKKTMNIYWSDEEKRKKASERRKEYFKNPENRKKTSENSTNYFKNPENRKKASEKTKAHFKDPENRKKMSIAKSKNPFTIDGKYFLNIVIAGKKLRVTKKTIWNRLKSPKFPNYKYI